MTNPRTFPPGEEEQPAAPPARPAPKAPQEPSTGDMQEVGAIEPEEVERRRRKVDGEAPVHENPGDQNSG